MKTKGNMETTKELIEATENFTGKNTVKNACTTGFMMIEMISEELAKEVAKVWVDAKKMKVELNGSKVYAF